MTTRVIQFPSSVPMYMTVVFFCYEKGCVTVYLKCSVHFFQELTKDSEEPIEVVFVSSDNSPEELMAYMKECHGDWLAVQHGAVLAEYDFIFI
jgi:hypothetical protein